MYFFAIITLIIFIVSIVLKSKQGTIVAIVAIAFIALFGSFRFFFNSQIIYDTSRLNSLEQRLNYELPEADRMITMDNFYFSESVGKFQGNAFVDIETSIKNDENWLNELSLDTVNKVSNAVSNELKNYNYFLLYDEVKQVYYDTQDNFYWSNCILMAYRFDTHSFVILYDFKV